jgi:energy-coupling factor transporter transmembrane protein EcfT
MALFETAIGIIISIVFFGSMGRSFGVRRLYVKFLLKLFEVCIVLRHLFIMMTIALYYSKLRHKENPNCEREKKEENCVVIGKTFNTFQDQQASIAVNLINAMELTLEIGFSIFFATRSDFLSYHG